MIHRSEPLTRRAGREITRAVGGGDGPPTASDDRTHLRELQDSSLRTRRLGSHAAIDPACSSDFSAITPAPDGSVECPFCRSIELATNVDDQQKCSRCARPILRLGGEGKSNGDLAVPVFYGQHRGVRIAGRGGMGIVLYGVNEASGAAVAIKLLGRARQQRKAIARFDREVAALRSISHPNIVRLLGHGAIGKQRFLVMDWVEGPTFRDLIEEGRRRGVFPCFEAARDWMVQTCAGLAAIHGAGVVHRDIKPANLILERSTVVRIADFGIARLSPELSERSNAGAEPLRRSVRGSPFGVPLTTAGEFTGTAHYTAPECFASALAASMQSDLYSLGVTFYELLVGERPLVASPPPSRLNCSIPRTFDCVIMKLLAMNPADRFSSAEEVAAALDDRV